MQVSMATYVWVITTYALMVCTWKVAWHYGIKEGYRQCFAIIKANARDDEFVPEWPG